MSRYRFGVTAVVVLVGLRMLIGFHFFMEGVGKLRDPKPFSAGFLGNAKGPLATTYRSMVWDVDGQQRFDRDQTVAFWDEFRQRVIGHYGFDESQIIAADQLLANYEQKLRATLGASSDEIHQYRQGLKRIAANQANPARREVSSLRDQAERIETEAKSKGAPVLAAINKLWDGYERDLNSLATAQQAHRGYLTMGVPGLVNDRLIDRIVPWFDLTIGALLLMGLFTRLAAVAGAAFLASVVLSQWPGSYGAAPVYYQSIEMLALLVLAALAAGRYAGLDFLLYAVRTRPAAPAKGKST